MAFDEELVQSSQKYVHDIACGMGTTFIISSDNHYGNILGRRLYHECLSIRRTHDAYDYEVSNKKKERLVESVRITHTIKIFSIHKMSVHWTEHPKDTSRLHLNVCRWKVMLPSGGSCTSFSSAGSNASYKSSTSRCIKVHRANHPRNTPSNHEAGPLFYVH